MRQTAFLLASFVLVCGCDNFPRDPNHTLERIRSGAPMRVGVAASLDGKNTGVALLERLADEEKSSLVLQKDSYEALLRDLETGRLDAVVGSFAETSPWKRRVVLSNPVLGKEPGDQKTPVLRIARPKGENAFIMKTDQLIEHAGARP